MLDVLNGLGMTDLVMQGTVIAGVLHLVGLVVTGLFAIFAWVGNKAFERRQHRQLRKQAQRDLQTAVLAEIDAVWRQWAIMDDLPQALDNIKNLFECDAEFVPFVTAEAGIAVFPAIVSEISVLDESEIAPVVRFYRQVHLVEGFGADLRSDRYATLSASRRMTMLIGYVTLVDQARAMAEEAIICLEASLEIDESRRLFHRKQALFNNRAAARTGRVSAPAD